MGVGRKLRIYLDTTIPNYLFADDRPDRMAYTWRLWERCVAGEFEVFVSDVLFDELDKCPQPKQGRMYGQLGRIGARGLEETAEVKELASAYVRSGVLRERDLGDCRHFAHAVVHECDIILSWNFNHIVNDTTRDRIKVVNAVSRYKEIKIVSPEEFLKGGRR